MRIIKGLFISLLVTVVLGFYAGTVDAHPGRTDSSGGHTCRTNCPSWGLDYGEYHYHNGGSSTDTAPPPQPTQAPVIQQQQTVTEPVVTTKKLIEQLRDLIKERRESKQLWSDLILSHLRGRTITKTITRTVSPQQSLVNQTTTSTQQTDKAVPTQQPPQEGFYQVTEVVDGDTIRVMYNGKIEPIRFLAIDTPETKDPRKPVQCFGDTASRKMSELVSGKNVKLQVDGTQPDRDKYFRLLRYVYLQDGTDVGAEMIKQGFAFAYTRFPSDKVEEYRGYEKKARETNAGLWGSCQIQESGNTKSTNAAQ